jgi:[histone H3]-lysine36 N-trimethyltransferase
MSDDGVDKKPEGVDTALSDMKLEESQDVPLDNIKMNGNAEHSPTPTATKDSRSPSLGESNSLTSAAQTPKSEGNEHEEILAGEIAVKLEPGKPPKLSRKSSQKVMSHPPPLFDHLPNATTEAVSTFQVIRDCIYGSKYMSSSEHDALGCDCSEDWSEYQNYLQRFQKILTSHRRWQESCLWGRLGLYQPCN